MTDNPTRREVLVTTTGLAAAGFAGCLGSASNPDSSETDSPTHHDHEDHSHGEITGPHESATVRMITTDAGTHFDPHVVWVEAGGTVTWELESGTHTTTAFAPANDQPERIPHEAAAWDSGSMSESGATFERTFETPGVYDYLCTPHLAGGMIGTVIVGEPEPHDQPGLAEPQSSLPDGAKEKLHTLNERVKEVLGHEDGHHDEGTETESGHHEDDDHHDGTETGTDHHDDGH